MKIFFCPALLIFLVALLVLLACYVYDFMFRVVFFLQKGKNILLIFEFHSAAFLREKTVVKDFGCSSKNNILCLGGIVSHQNQSKNLIKYK